MTDLWTYRPDVECRDVDLSGFDVEATDGHIGKVDEATYDEHECYLVVDTGFWIFGKKRVVPARAIKRVDRDEQKVFMELSKGHVRDAPDHSETWRLEPEEFEAMSAYYQPFGFGWR